MLSLYPCCGSNFELLPFKLRRSWGDTNSTIKCDGQTTDEHNVMTKGKTICPPPLHGGAIKIIISTSSSATEAAGSLWQALMGTDQHCHFNCVQIQPLQLVKVLITTRDNLQSTEILISSVQLYKQNRKIKIDYQ